MKTDSASDDTSRQAPVNKAVPDSPADIAVSVLAQRLAFLLQKSPDWVLLVERWESLPDALKVGILAMITAAQGGQE